MVPFGRRILESFLDRTGARHSVALIAAISLNGLLVLFLAAWVKQVGRIPLASLPAIPLEVVSLEPEQMEIVKSQQERAEPFSQPEPVEPLIPAPPELEIPDLLPALAPPDTLVLPADLDSLAEMSPELPPGISMAPPGEAGPAAPGAGGGLGPVLITPPDLSLYYPRLALRQGITGRTTIQLSIDADGRVRRVDVLRSTPGGVFDHAARRVGLALHFRPARRDGRKIPASVLLNLIWKVE